MNQSVDVVKRILLVDHQESALQSMSKVIEDSCKYSVHAIPDPKRVIEVIREREIDLVISDLTMPDLDGEEVSRLVRDYDENIPVIIFTGRGNRQLKMRLLEAGAWDFVPKGTEDSEALVIAIEKAFALRAKTVQVAQGDRQGPADEESIFNGEKSGRGPFHRADPGRTGNWQGIDCS